MKLVLVPLYPLESNLELKKLPKVAKAPVKLKLRPLQHNTKEHYIHVLENICQSIRRNSTFHSYNSQAILSGLNNMNKKIHVNNLTHPGLPDNKKQQRILLLEHKLTDVERRQLYLCIKLNHLVGVRVF